MRAVERTPWAERRSSRHDEICLLVAEAPQVIVARLARPLGNIVSTHLEVSCGAGFVDAVISCQFGRVLVEVKTDSEPASAGDVLRQLRWYKRERSAPDTFLACVTESEPAPSFRRLLEREGVAVVTARDLFDALEAAGADDFFSPAVAKA